MDKRQQIEEAISTQESLRGTLDDDIINTTIAALKEKLTALNSSPQHQRKLVTILFTDIVESTRLIHGLDPEELMEMVDATLTRLAAHVDLYGGHVTRFQGDGFKAVFGLPIAQENDPAQAIRAGLAIQAEAARIAGELESGSGLADFQVRVGINTGLVFSGGETEGEDTIMGEAINLAARLESAAVPGTILISHNSYKHVQGIFDFKPLEPIEAKGFPEPVAVYRVLREKTRPFYRGMHGVEGIETKMVGREIEFQQLQKSLMDVIELREMQMITVAGEAGLGKSRLLYEFQNWVDLLPEEVWLYKGRARVEAQGSPFDLLRDLFANQFDIQDNDSVHVVRDKLIIGFGAEFGEDVEGEKKVHFIGHLLGYDFQDSSHLIDFLEHPQLLREKAINYFREYIQYLAEKRPILILLEDLHWSDEASLDAFNLLAMALMNQPVFILATTRHGLLERRPHWGEGQNFHQLIFIRPLSKRDSQHLVAEVLQLVEDIPENLTELVVSNAEGNPFYIEELIKMLVEDGVIVRDEPLWRVETARLEELHVPSTLTGVLQARLDGLPREEREILQSASVIGRVFWDQILDYINSSLEKTITDRKIIDVLDELRYRELIFRRETSAFAESSEHIFKHSLLRDVTYESVLLRIRPTYHALAADWLIEHAGGRVGEFSGMIADHLELAGRNTQACQYLIQAGKQAAEKFANSEAASYFTRALEITAETDLETQYEILLERVKNYNLMGNREAQEADINALEFLSNKMGDKKKQAEALLRKAGFAERTGDYQRSLEAAKSIVTLAKKISDQTMEASGQIAWGRVLWRQYDWDNAKDRFNMALELARKLDDQRLIGVALRLLGIIADNQGEQDASIRYFQETLSIYRKLGDRIGESNVLSTIGLFYFHHFEIDQALVYYQRGLTLCREIGYRLTEGNLLSNIGFIYSEIGMYSKAKIAFEQALEIDRQIQYQQGIGYTTWGLGFIACFIEKDYKKTKAYAEEGLLAARITNNMYFESLSVLLLAYSQIGLENWSEAERLTKDSTEAFRKANMPHRMKYIWGSLARIYMAKGMTDQAVGQINLILDNFEINESMIEPKTSKIQIFYTCCQVLVASDDPRARQVIETAYKQVQEYVSKIQNEEFRESFLNNVPWHRGIIEMWEAELGNKNGGKILDHS